MMEVSVCRKNWIENTGDNGMDMFSRKDLFRLFAPLLVEQLLAVLVGMADVVMVAAVGETAVSGVALVDYICLLGT